MAGRADHGEPPVDSGGVIIPFPSDKTVQQKGRDYERRAAKRDGARLHPGSGAGRIKHDASTADRLIEYKRATKQFTLSGKYVKDLRDAALRQDKEAELHVAFPEQKITAIITFVHGTAEDD